VLFSGHQDHDGVGPEVNGDPIWNGADDNASVTVAMLAIGSAWSTQPADRLYLFGTDLRKGLIVLAILLAIPPLSCLHSCCFKWRYDRTQCT
jgi:Zn-dependent M28 family amino/carboxypeptidase